MVCRSVAQAYLSERRLRRRDLEDRVSRCLPLKCLKGRVFCGIEVGSSRSGLEEILFENRSRLLRFQFGHGNCLRTATTGKRCRSCCPDVAHPLHDTIRSNQKAAAVLLNQEHWNGMRLTTFTTAYSEQRHRPYFDTGTQK